MDLELVALHQPTVRQKLTDMLSLVALQLKDLSVFRIFHNGSVAGKLFLTGPHNLLEVVLSRQTLGC